MQAIIERLNDLDVRVSVGALSRNDRRLIIGVREQSQRVEDILDLPLAVREHGAVLRLRDVAAVHDTIAETRSVYRINGKPSVTVIVDKEPHINTLSVAERVKATLADVAKEFPGHLLVTTVTDKSRQMREELENLQREVVVSLALIWIVLVVALASLRAPLLIMASLVVSLAGTMVVFALLGLSLHLLTLAGLVLGFGRVVDDAIVVLDNIQRRSAAGVSDETIVLGVQQVRLPVPFLWGNRTPQPFLTGLVACVRAGRMTGARKRGGAWRGPLIVRNGRCGRSGSGGSSKAACPAPSGAGKKACCCIFGPEARAPSRPERHTRYAAITARAADVLKTVTISLHIPN